MTAPSTWVPGLRSSSAHTTTPVPADMPITYTGRPGCSAM